MPSRYIPTNYEEASNEDKTFLSFVFGVYGFGLYALTHLPEDQRLPLSNETLDQMWSAYRAEHEDHFTDIIHVTTELSDLNSSEEAFINHPELYHIFDYWKDKLLLEELPNLLSPENLISWSTFDFVTLDMFYDMLEVEFGVDPTSELNESILDTGDSLDLMGKLMHIVSPFILLMLRYAYYQTWLKKTTVNDEFRRKRATANYVSDTNGLRLSELHDVYTGGLSARRIYKSFANLFSQSIKEYIAQTPRAINEDDIDVQTYISMAHLEVSRLGSDEAFLREHCQPFFVDSLIEWHRGYYAYLIHEIHSFDGYEKYQIPGYRIEEVQNQKKKIDIDEILTPLGRPCCERVILPMVKECKTAAEFGELMYKLQRVYHYVQDNPRVRNKAYMFLQKIAKLKFDSNGDFSNCNKGWSSANKKAQKMA